ncbi:hypothetical protein [Nocardia sp. MW-W600-9]
MAGSDDDNPTGDALSTGERRELEWLRAEVAQLRGEPPPPPRGHGGLRWTAVVALLALVGVLLVTSVVARFARSEILNTDRYVSTVAPLGEDPIVKAAITNRVTDEIFAQVDVEGLTEQALTALIDASNLATNAPRLDQAVVGLAPVIAGQAKTFVHDTVESLVESDEFEDLWIQANRAAHTTLVAVVTGDTGDTAVQVDDSGTVSISLSTVIDKVKTRLSGRGFAFADKIPQIDKQFVLVQSPELAKAQRAVRALDKAADVLPWLTLLVAAGAIWAAPRSSRLRALAAVGVTFVVTMALLAVAILICRSLYLDNLPPEIRSPEAAAAVFDTIVVPLRTTLRAVFVVGLVVAVGAYLVGGSASALAVRRGFGRALEVLRRPSTRTPTAVEMRLARARVPLRAAIIGIAVLVIVFWNYPTGAVVGWTVLIALLTLLLLEILVRPVLTRARQLGDAAVVT